MAVVQVLELMEDQAEEDHQQVLAHVMQEELETLHLKVHLKEMEEQAVYTKQELLLMAAEEEEQQELHHLYLQVTQEQLEELELLLKLVVHQ